MADLIQLKEGRYKGVEMIVKTMPTTGGRRVNVIRYPGANKQSVEDQGLVPRQFTVTGIIPHDGYFDKRDALLKAFEDGEKGSLIHPTFGEVQGVRNGAYSLNEIISDLGKAQYTVEFFIDDAVGAPVSSGSFASQAQTASSTLNASLAKDIADGYKVTNNFTGNFSNASSDALNISSALTSATSKINPLTDNLNAFNASISGYEGNVNNLIQLPDSFGSGIGELFQSFDSLYDAAADTLTAISGVFGFGANDESFKQNTAGRIERQKNQDLVRANVKTQSLSYAYVAAVQIDFESEEALALVNSQLEDQYTDVRNNELLSNESLLNLDELRIQANSALSQILLNTRKVITINTRLIPLSVLVYQYYGSTDLVSVISELNSIQQNAFVEGNVRILTE